MAQVAGVRQARTADDDAEQCGAAVQGQVLALLGDALLQRALHSGVLRACQLLLQGGDLAHHRMVRPHIAAHERGRIGAGLARHQAAQADEARMFARAVVVQRAGLQASGGALLVSVSCVGRRLVLGERTEEEVESVQEAAAPGTGHVNARRLSQPLLVGQARRLPGFNFDGSPAEDMQYADHPHKARSILTDPVFALNTPTLQAYRPYHLQHHRYVQQAEDPDLVLSAPFPISPASLRRKMWRDLSGQTFYKQRIQPLAQVVGHQHAGHLVGMQRGLDHHLGAGAGRAVVQAGELVGGAGRGAEQGVVDGSHRRCRGSSQGRGRNGRSQRRSASWKAPTM